MIRRLAEITAHVAREKISGRPATTASDIPVAPTDVTREWLDAVLCNGHAGAAVERFETTEVSSGTSERWALKVGYNDAGAAAGLPVDLFAKTTRGARQRVMLGMLDLVETEPAFFTHVRPQIDIETPRGYHGGFNAKSLASISLIEDIDATKGARFSTPATPITRGQMEELLANLAVMHGQFWASPELDGFGWLHTPADHFRMIEKLASPEKRLVVGARRARDITPAELEGRDKDIFEAIRRSVAIATSGTPTFLHGDPHVGNTYVTRDGRMGLTDWQVVVRGNWAYDVGYLISTGLSVDDRREWERDLLRFYLERLAAAGGEPPDEEAAWLAYRQQVLYPYLAWVFTLGRGALHPKMQPPEVSRGVIERITNAIVDLDAMAACR